MRLFKKQNTIMNKIEEYISSIDTCVNRFENCIKDLLHNSGAESNNKAVESVHNAESAADNFKRNIEYHLYEKALIPESRGDVLGIIETLDRIPNLLESICYQVHLQKIIIPVILINDYFTLVKVNTDSYRVLKDAVKGLFYNKNLIENIQRIDSIESESDRIERQMIKKLFNSNLEKTDKLILKELIANTAGISDRAQAVADRLSLAIIKRRI